MTTHEIKPLEWQVLANGNIKATGPFDCSYIIKVEPSVFLFSDDTFDGAPFVTTDAAKAGAQADYEQRIRSALVPATSPASDKRVYPKELTDELRDVLSTMLWNSGRIAHALRAGGDEIKTRAEDEQAHVLHWLIGLALEHGPEWREKASERIRQISASKAKEG